MLNQKTFLRQLYNHILTPYIILFIKIFLIIYPLYRSSKKRLKFRNDN